MEANVPRDCRPIEVLNNENPLPVKTRKEVWKTQQGQCIYRDEFVINQPTPVDWQHMKLQVKENRYCSKTKNSGYWFHPGDTATSTFNYPKGDYSTLVIEGSGLGDGVWNIELIDNDEVFVQESIPQRLDERYSILLNMPFKRKHHNALIRLSVPENSTQHLFIQKISLTN